MTNNEKIYLLDKCIKKYGNAIIKLKERKYFDCLIELGKAKELQEIIEEFIDCQPSKYYKKHKLIVLLSNEMEDYINLGKIKI